MQYLVFEDPVTKIHYPVILCNHLDPYKVSVEGMKVSSGGLVNISPDAPFTVGASEFHRRDDSDMAYVGLALQGSSASEFKRRSPILLFKMVGDDNIRKAFTVQELIDLNGFPDDVVWVSRAEGSQAFDMFFEVTPTGSVKPKERMSLSDIELYAECLRNKVGGTVGHVTAGYAIVVNKVEDINESDLSTLGGPDKFGFKYDSLTGITYWWTDTNDTIKALLGHRLSAMGYRSTKHVIITKEGHLESISVKTEQVMDQPEPVTLKKPKKKNGLREQDT